MTDDTGDEVPLIFRYDGDEPPWVPVRLDVVGFDQIVLASLRPDLPKTVIAEQWAEALNLSRGSAMLAQLVTRTDAEAENWGPCDMVFPEVSPELDDAITDDGVGGLLLGWDFLKQVTLTYLGPLAIIAFTQAVEGGEAPDA
jgi:hypothetical protein